MRDYIEQMIVVCRLSRTEQVCFNAFESLSVSKVMRERIPEGGGGDREGSVSPGLVLGLDGRDEEVDMGRSKMAGRGVIVKEVSEAGGGKVAKGLESDEKNFKLDSLLDEEPV